MMWFIIYDVLWCDLWCVMMLFTFLWYDLCFYDVIYNLWYVFVFVWYVLWSYDVIWCVLWYLWCGLWYWWSVLWYLWCFMIFMMWYDMICFMMWWYHTFLKSSPSIWWPVKRTWVRHNSLRAGNGSGKATRTSTWNIIFMMCFIIYDIIYHFYDVFYVLWCVVLFFTMYFYDIYHDLWCFLWYIIWFMMWHTKSRDAFSTRNDSKDLFSRNLDNIRDP